MRAAFVVLIIVGLALMSACGSEEPTPVNLLDGARVVLLRQHDVPSASRRLYRSARPLTRTEKERGIARHQRQVSQSIEEFATTHATATAPPDDALVDTPVVGDHQEEAPDVAAWIAAGGALSVTTECGGCLLDVELFRWTNASGRKSEPVPTTHIVENDFVDAARLDVPLDMAGHVAALDVRVTVLDNQDRAHEVSRVIFVRVLADGTGVRLQPTTWADYVCSEGFGRCEPDGFGGIDLILSTGSDP